MEQKQDILIGRDAEKKHLESIVLSKEAEFVVVYGRRRVGKTFLVNTFFDDNYSFKLTGLAKKSKRDIVDNQEDSEEPGGTTQPCNTEDIHPSVHIS